MTRAARGGGGGAAGGRRTPRAGHLLRQRQVPQRQVPHGKFLNGKFLNGKFLNGKLLNTAIVSGASGSQVALAWLPICDGDNRAVAIQGKWDYRMGVPGGGGRRDFQDVTFACVDTAIGECVVAGYRPWAFRERWEPDPSGVYHPVQVPEASGRSGPFVAVNCAAIPAELAESELFGHVAGAFSGARARHEGLFAAAQGGTLFLDEIGEMPAPLQAKLLRALAQKEIRPVGAIESVPVDVRVVCATNRELAGEVAAGRFRGDLLARISAWPLEVPPLRARRDDILPLAAQFAARCRVTARAAEALALHDWPYNVRELEQTVAAASVRAGAERLIRLEHLPQPLRARLADGDAPPACAPGSPLADVARDAAPTRAELERVLAHFGGSVTETARFFARDRKQIYRWAERLGVEVRR